jgi:hypothetical protein
MILTLNRNDFFETGQIEKVLAELETNGSATGGIQSCSFSKKCVAIPISKLKFSFVLYLIPFINNYQNKQLRIKFDNTETSVTFEIEKVNTFYEKHNKLRDHSKFNINPNPLTHMRRNNND